MASLGQGGAGIPTPTKGSGATELTTDSNDPAVLRDLLERARERLAFYESFDRIIGENIRRSGELMVETVALREQAKAQAEQIRAERAAFEAARQADRDRYRALVQGALDDVAATRPVIEQLLGRLHEALATLDGESSAPAVEPAAVEVETPAEDFTPEPPSEEELEVAATSEATPVAAPEPPAEAIESGASPETPPAPEEAAENPAAAVSTEPAPTPEAETTEGPRTVEILAHGVTTAAIAISLQRTLRELAHVRTVEAREFADGVLRLQVQADARIGEQELASWLETHEGQLANASDRVVEINLGSTPAT